MLFILSPALAGNNMWVAPIRSFSVRVAEHIALIKSGDTKHTVPRHYKLHHNRNLKGTQFVVIDRYTPPGGEVLRPEVFPDWKPSGSTSCSHILCSVWTLSFTSTLSSIKPKKYRLLRLFYTFIHCFSLIFFSLFCSPLILLHFCSHSFYCIFAICIWPYMRVHSTCVHTINILFVFISYLSLHFTHPPFECHYNFYYCHLFSVLSDTFIFCPTLLHGRLNYLLSLLHCGKHIYYLQFIVLFILGF